MYVSKCDLLRIGISRIVLLLLSQEEDTQCISLEGKETLSEGISQGSSSLPGPGLTRHSVPTLGSDFFSGHWICMETSSIAIVQAQYQKILSNIYSSSFVSFKPLTHSHSFYPSKNTPGSFNCATG